MKVVLAALLLALMSDAASAQTSTIHKLTWALTGFSAGTTNLPWLELDVLETGRYMAAHGAVLSETRQLSPVTGTCAKTSTGFYCNLQIDRNSYFLDVDVQLNGKITGRDAAGNVLPEATATLHSRQ